MNSDGKRNNIGTTVSAIIITKNEAINIVECIKSVHWADEVIVADSGSTDDTVQLANDAGASTHAIKWQGYGHAKQTALGYATCDWVISLDADERVTPDLASEIQKALLDSNCDGYEIPILTNFVGRWIHHSGWRPKFALRLFRREQGKFTEALVHETVIVSGRVERMRHDLLHFSYRSLESYLEKLNRYTSLAAAEMHAKGKRFKLWQPLLKPPAIFIKRYLLRLGVLDGWTGFQIAFLSAVYVFVKYAKLWSLEQRDQTASNSEPYS